jgi:hypothetical protein
LLIISSFFLNYLRATSSSLLNSSLLNSSPSLLHISPSSVSKAVYRFYYETASRDEEEMVDNLTMTRRYGLVVALKD